MELVLLCNHCKLKSVIQSFVQINTEIGLIFAFPLIIAWLHLNYLARPQLGTAMKPHNIVTNHKN